MKPSLQTEVWFIDRSSAEVSQKGGGGVCWWSMCRTRGESVLTVCKAPRYGAMAIRCNRATALGYSVLIKSHVALTRLLAAQLSRTQSQAFNKHQMATGVFLNSLHTLPYRSHTHTHAHARAHKHTHAPLKPTFFFLAETSQSQPLFPSIERSISRTCLRVYKRSEGGSDVMCEAPSGGLGGGGRNTTPGWLKLARYTQTTEGLDPD